MSLTTEQGRCKTGAKKNEAEVETENKEKKLPCFFTATK